MSRVRLAKVDIKYVLFTEIYHRLEEPKAKRRAFGLLEAAISCYAKRGFESVTMEMVAREAGVTRPLLRHYFKDAKEIQELSIKYIRLLFQKIAIDAMMTGKTPVEMLGRYVEGCFSWKDNFKTHSSVWLAFLQRCTLDRKMHALNTLASETGADRLAHMLEAAQSQGAFKTVDVDMAAKQIQAVIAGSLILAATETLPNPAAFASQIRRLCLSIAGAPEASLA